MLQTYGVLGTYLQWVTFCVKFDNSKKTRYTYIRCLYNCSTLINPYILEISFYTTRSAQQSIRKQTVITNKSLIYVFHDSILILQLLTNAQTANQRHPHPLWRPLWHSVHSATKTISWKIELKWSLYLYIHLSTIVCHGALNWRWGERPLSTS